MTPAPALVLAALSLLVAGAAPALADSDTSTAAISPSPSPSPSPSSCGTSGRMTLALGPQHVVAGELVTLTATYTGDLTEGNVQTGGGDTGNYRWADPRTKAEPEWTPGQPTRNDVHDVPEGETVVQTWTLRPTTNTRLGAIRYGFQAGCFYADGFLWPAAATVVEVAPRLSLAARRNGVRDYTFSGTASRPGQILSLVRVSADGSQVLTAQTRATADGAWSLRRRFTGSGRFDFVLRTGRDMANAPGVSNTRRTVIY